jgi:competence protein ComEC
VLLGCFLLLLGLGWGRFPALIVPFSLAVAFAGGLNAGAIRTSVVAGPVLSKPLGPLNISGVVESVEAHQDQWRVVLGDLTIEHLSSEQTPIRVRLTVRDLAGAQPGTAVGVLAKLLPPPEPQVPGAYDFARGAWFQRLGAVGFAYGPLKPFVPSAASPEARDGLPAQWAATKAALKAEVERLRGWLHRRIIEAFGPDYPASGAVAAALVTGMRGAIPPETTEAYRASGLAHLLAISGLHMGLAGGIFFVTLRGLIALCPPLALRVNGKKVAAFGALVGMSLYLLISGAGVPAQRAFIMGVFLFGAVIFDRRAISLRVLGAAAVVILALYPEALVGASFQMSFAAATALVAVYEQVSGPLSRWRRAPAEQGRWGSGLRGLVLYLVGIALTTLVAGLATMPFAAYHFHTISVFGLVSNLLVVPLVSLAVMPLLVILVFLFPVGNYELLGSGLGKILDLIDQVARTVTEWPYATLAVPPVSTLCVVLFTVGGLWVLLWRQRWRWCGLGPLLLAAVLPWMATPPDIVVNAQGDLIAVQRGDGMILPPGRRDRYTRDMWVEWWGESRYAGTWKDGPWQGPDMACDPLGCRISVGPQSVVWLLDRAAAEEDCQRALLVLSPLTLPREVCPPSKRVVDRVALKELGGVLIWVAPDGQFDLQSVSAYRGKRPWVRSGP